MEFKETLWKARGYDRKAMMEIIEMYHAAVHPEIPD